MNTRQSRTRARAWRAALACTAMLFLAQPASAATTATWTVVQSPNVSFQANYLAGIAAVSPSDVWAVGAEYRNDTSTPAPLIEHWDGTRWSLVRAPVATWNYNELSAVSATSSTDAWSVGYRLVGPYLEQTFVVHWDGVRWRIVPSPNVGSGSNSLSGVAAISPTDVWAVGQGDSPDINNGRVLIQHWDGTSWSVVRSPNTGTRLSQLTAISALSSTDIWAVGMRGHSTLVEHWDGVAWSIVPSPDGAFASSLSGVSARSASDIWAVGSTGDHTLTEHWDGSTWTVVPSPDGTKQTNELGSVVALGSGDVWAVGSTANTLTVTWRTLTEHWDGTAWTVVPSPNPSPEYDYLTAVGGFPGGDVWAVGAADEDTLTMRTTG
jgi:hypothetical protein